MKISEEKDIADQLEIVAQVGEHRECIEKWARPRPVL
jgi:hypothetical protein